MKTLDAKSTIRESQALPRPVRSAVTSTKIVPRHLERLAIVYVRQSSTRQVQENIESTQLQYRLVDRAEGLGWPAGRVVVIDDDLGVSGQSIEGRVGFQRLLAEVSLDHVGMVLGIERAGWRGLAATGINCWSCARCLARCWAMRTASTSRGITTTACC